MATLDVLLDRRNCWEQSINLQVFRDAKDIFLLQAVAEVPLVREVAGTGVERAVEQLLRARGAAEKEEEKEEVEEAGRRRRMWWWGRCSGGGGGG
jgi:hypothetical protein